MATARERAIKAELLKDPAYREAWEDVRRAAYECSLEIKDGYDADPSPIHAAVARVFALLDVRPDLKALVELAEQEYP